MLYPFQLFCMNFGKRNLFSYIINQLLTSPIHIFSYCVGATHIVHHYVPGQPFYIREIVYRQVKPLMVEKGVRLNDFGVVSRANHYFDDSNKDAPGGAAPGMVGRVVSPNNSHIDKMCLWVVLCSTLGLASYVIFDQWTTFALGRRIVHKYIRKHKNE